MSKRENSTSDDAIVHTISLLCHNRDRKTLLDHGDVDSGSCEIHK